MNADPYMVDVVVYDGVDELDAIGPLEVLRRAAGLGDAFDVRLVTHRSCGKVTGAHGLTFVPDAVYQPGRANLILVPGGGWATRSAIGAWGEMTRGDLLGPLARSHEAGSICAGVCTGTMLLAHAGVVGTRPATTHRSALEDLAATGATVVGARVVDDGDLVTCGGVTSGLDLALHLVAREVSVEVAAAISRQIEYHHRFGPRRDVELDGRPDDGATSRSSSQLPSRQVWRRPG